MKTFTVTDINNWEPCYSPTGYLDSNWSGTAVDMLSISTIAVNDRLWVVMRTDLLPEAKIRLFAAWCANQVSQTAECSIIAINTANDLANGMVSESDRFIIEYNAFIAVSNSENSTATVATQAAANCILQNTSKAAINSAAWVATNSNSDTKMSIETAQINYAIDLFNNYGLS